VARLQLCRLVGKRHMRGVSKQVEQVMGDLGWMPER